MIYKNWTGDLEDLCVLYRGIIVHHVVSLEELIDSIFLNYYLEIGETLSSSIESSLKKEEFKHTLLSKEGFNLMSKYNSIKFLIEKHCPDYISKFPDLLTEITKMIELRNIFAHRKYNESLSNLDKKEIVLIYHTTERGKIITQNKIMNPELIDSFSISYFAAYEVLQEAGRLLQSAKGI